MAIIIKTKTPNQLLDILYKGIEQYNVGKWTMLPDGRITPSSLLWKNEAFLKPQIWVDENELRFGLIKRKDRKHITSKLYTHFHSKFVEMMLSNFESEFISITATSMKADPDDF